MSPVWRRTAGIAISGIATVRWAARVLRSARISRRPPDRWRSGRPRSTGRQGGACGAAPGGSAWPPALAGSGRARAGPATDATPRPAHLARPIGACAIIAPEQVEAACAQHPARLLTLGQLRCLSDCHVGQDISQASSEARGLSGRPVARLRPGAVCPAFPAWAARGLRVAYRSRQRSPQSQRDW
jgi:hypothetical protein